MQWSWYQNMVVSSGYVLVWYPTITGSILTYHRAKSAHGGRNLMDTGHGGLTWKSVSVILRRKSMLKHGWNKWSNSCNSCLCIQMFPGLSIGFVTENTEHVALANSLGPYLNIFFNFKQFGSLKGACLEKHRQKRDPKSLKNLGPLLVCQLMPSQTAKQGLLGLRL